MLKMVRFGQENNIEYAKGAMHHERLSKLKGKERGYYMAIFSYFSVNGINSEEFPFKSEAAMEAFLYENASVFDFDKSDTVNILQSQVPWKRGNKEGRIYLLASYGADLLAVIELKKGDLCEDDVKQLESYFDDQYHLKNQEKLFAEDGLKNDPDWCGFLVGSGIKDSLLLDVLKSDFKSKDGIPLGFVIVKRFQGNGQVFIHTTVYPPKFKKKYPVFEFDGTEYKTSQLAHAMIKKYVRDHYDGLSFSDLDRLLDKNKFKTKKPLIRLQNDGGKDLEGNYYLKPDKILSLEDGSKVVVLSWWYCSEIKTIKDIGNVLGFSFKQIG